MAASRLGTFFYRNFVKVSSAKQLPFLGNVELKGREKLDLRLFIFLMFRTIDKTFC